MITTAQNLYFIRDTERIIGRDRQTLRRWWNKGLFPKPKFINSRCCWHADTIKKWLSEQGGQHG